MVFMTEPGGAGCLDRVNLVFCFMTAGALIQGKGFLAIMAGAAGVPLLHISHCVLFFISQIINGVMTSPAIVQHVFLIHMGGMGKNHLARCFGSINSIPDIHGKGRILKQQYHCKNVESNQAFHKLSSAKFCWQPAATFLNRYNPPLYVAPPPSGGGWEGGSFSSRFELIRTFNDCSFYPVPNHQLIFLPSHSTWV